MQGFTHTEEARCNIVRGRGDGGPRSLTSSRTMAWGTAVSDTAIRPANRRANPWLGRDYRVLIAFPETPKSRHSALSANRRGGKAKVSLQNPLRRLPLARPNLGRPGGLWADLPFLGSDPAGLGQLASHLRHFDVRPAEGRVTARPSSAPFAAIARVSANRTPLYASPRIRALSTVDPGLQSSSA